MFDIREIHQPKNLEEALAVAGQHPDAIIIAGGTDVLIKIRDGKLVYRDLLSIHGLSELHGIEEESCGDLLIGPLNSFRDLLEHPLICRHVPILARAAATVGGPQVRVMGTLGGNLANGATSADTASSLHALEAELLLQSAISQRLVPINEFHLGPGRTACAPGEILTKIIIRRVNFIDTGGWYIKYAMREAMDIATLGCSVMVKPDADGKCIEQLRIAFGVAAPVPLRTVETEAELKGSPIEEAAQRIATLVRTEINPRDSWRASKAFRLQIAGVMAERALLRAWQEALERREYNATNN